MAKLVEFSLSDNKKSVLIESTDVDNEYKVHQAGGLMEKHFDKLLETVRPFCESITNSFQELSTKPHSVSAEFGLNVTSEGNIFIVKASGQATLRITLNWNNIE